MQSVPVPNSSVPVHKEMLTSSPKTSDETPTAITIKKPIPVVPNTLPLLSQLTSIKGPQPTGISASQIAARQLHQSLQTSGGSVAHTGHHGNIVRLSAGKTHTQEEYYRKWRRLKKVVKDIVFVNASMCDEVIRVEEKLAKAKEERRFLLRKLLQYHSVNETASTPIKQEVISTPTTSKLPVSLPILPDSTPESVVKPKPKKKVTPTTPVTSGDKKKSVVSKDSTDPAQPKPKRLKHSANKRVTIPPLTLDLMGRPLFPIVLNDLTIYSIGEIVSDRLGFHSTESIYPEGYCSTRLYASMKLDQTCLYTCKISDDGSGPIFEIAPEDWPEKRLRGQSPSECHSLLLKAINKAKGMDILPTTGRGCDFFGLTNPVIQNLIQSCPGARKCSGYKWMKFEVNKNLNIESINHGHGDPTVSFTALKSLASTAAVKSLSTHLEPSTSLRSLLTSGPFSTNKSPNLK
ncbi:transforming growth factor beta regulator 1-like isoform X1 [Gigantopelta aegis]|uniref:transforming growth factor beta regulator 1-like isoform X1 n=1 Tax=Gigantopelta aegis TaxID=1735272 RepID=UPI001B88C59B|nr:transforming growth factor beta regulator 1-like isoform X1 [Gigantopelta aegis]